MSMKKGLLVFILCLAIFPFIGTLSSAATINEAELNDTYGQANLINIGDIINGAINPSGDVDYFKFTGTAGQTIAIDIDAQVNGSSLDSVVRLYDSDGTTQVAFNDDDSGNLDSSLFYTLPHSGDFYIQVENYGTQSGGSNYFYSLILFETGTMNGTVSYQSGGNPDEKRFHVYKLDGNLLNVFYLYDSAPQYTLTLPAGGFKIYCDNRDSHGEWYNHKSSFMNADVLTIPPGGQISNVDCIVNKRPEFQPQLNSYNFSTGSTLLLDIQVTNGSIPSKQMVSVEVLYPDTGLKSATPIGNRIVTYTGIIDVAANANLIADNFFTYTFKGSEPPGEYMVKVSIYDVSNAYGASDNHFYRSYSQYFRFTP